MLTFYNIGLNLTVIMMVVRGVTQVLEMTISSGLNAAISGMAGVGHILTAISLILIILQVKNSISKQQ